MNLFAEIDAVTDIYRKSLIDECARSVPEMVGYKGTLYKQEPVRGIESTIPGRKDCVRLIRPDGTGFTVGLVELD